jgi:hypothetical protein
MVLQRLPATLAAALLFSSCAATSNLPVHRNMGGGPAALIEGTLALEGDCLVIIDPLGDVRLPIWPESFRVVGKDLFDGPTVVGRVGGPIAVVGGEYGPDEQAYVQSLMTNELPDGCQPALFWLVTEMATAVPAYSAPPSKDGG